MNNPDERRSFSRITFDGNTTIAQGSNQWPVTLIVLSLKGLLVEEPEKWAADTATAMQANIQLDDETVISMAINWRHAANGLIGFECAHIDIDSIIHLRRLVELNLGDDELLERELALLGK